MHAAAPICVQVILKGHDCQRDWAAPKFQVGEPLSRASILNSIYAHRARRFPMDCTCQLVGKTEKWSVLNSNCPFGGIACFITEKASSPR
jgi:hypothetical protein